MFKKIMKKYYEFGFKKVIGEYKNYSKDEKAYVWFAINKKTFDNVLLVAPNYKLSNFRFFRLLKSMFLFLLLIILMSYFLDGKIFFVSIFLIMLDVQNVSNKQDLNLQQQFENINEKKKKKQRARNLNISNTKGEKND